MVEEEPCIIKATERSKSGKHGHANPIWISHIEARVRVVCVGVFDNNKRSLTIPSGHMVEIPEITKSTAQINYIEANSINIMDLETYESIDIDWPQDEALKKKLKELQAAPDKISTTQVEYWLLGGKTLINRVFSN